MSVIEEMAGLKRMLEEDEEIRRRLGTPTREPVAVVEDTDERVDALIADIDTGKITLDEAVRKANKMLKEEYSDKMHTFIWEVGGYLDRMEEKEEKKRFFESLTEEEKRRYLERGGCLYPCEVCVPNVKGAPCYDP
jgi:hypothetical protein